MAVVVAKSHMIFMYTSLNKKIKNRNFNFLIFLSFHLSSVTIFFLIINFSIFSFVIEVYNGWIHCQPNGWIEMINLLLPDKINDLTHSSNLFFSSHVIILLLLWLRKRIKICFLNTLKKPCLFYILIFTNERLSHTYFEKKTKKYLCESFFLLLDFVATTITFDDSIGI